MGQHATSERPAAAIGAINSAAFLDGLDVGDVLSDTLVAFDSLSDAAAALAGAAAERGATVDVGEARDWLRAALWHRALELRAGAVEQEPDELRAIVRLLAR